MTINSTQNYEQMLGRAFHHSSHVSRFIFMHFILQLQYLLSVKAKRRSLRLYELLSGRQTEGEQEWNRPDWAQREKGHKEMTYELLTGPEKPTHELRQFSGLLI